jgi:hypothetical protein
MMQKLLQIKHWKLSTILIVPMILSANHLEFEFRSITSKEVSLVLALVYIVILFSLILNIGLFINKIPENPFQFRRGLVIFSTLCCILGYSELNFSRIYNELNYAPELFQFSMTLMTMFGIIITFYNIPKSLKSIELGREATFKEYIVDALLLFALPIGIWFIQPRVNRLFLVNEMTRKEQATTTPY